MQLSNKNKFNIAVIVLLFFRFNNPSDFDVSSTKSQPETKTQSPVNTEPDINKNIQNALHLINFESHFNIRQEESRRIIVDWTAVKKTLQEQNYVWDSNKSYTQEHGCSYDQQFVCFTTLFKNRPTSGLIALLNKKDEIALRR